MSAREPGLLDRPWRRDRLRARSDRSSFLRHADSAALENLRPYPTSVDLLRARLLEPRVRSQRRRIEGVPELRRPTPRVCVCRLSLRSLRRAEDCRELTLYTWWLFHVLSSSRQLFEQRLRVLQVRRVEALIDLS